MTKVPGVLLIKCKDRIVRVLKTLNKNQAICTQGVHATMHKVKRYSNEIFVRATNWETEKKAHLPHQAMITHQESLLRFTKISDQCTKRQSVRKPNSFPATKASWQHSVEFLPWS